VPPLRERKDEIHQLIEFFTGKYAKRLQPAGEPPLTSNAFSTRLQKLSLARQRPRASRTW